VFASDTTKRVVPPHPVVGDVHARLAGARGFGQRAVGVDERLVEERGRLLAPDAHARRVDRRLQRLNRRAIEAATEIARRRRVRNPLRAQGVEIALVLTAQLDVLQTRPAAQDVIGDPQDVIRFVIRQMDFQHVHRAIDRRDEARVLDEAMHQPDAADLQALHPFVELVVNGARRQHRRGLRRPRQGPQPILHSPFAPG
jgi:hypothetical protein